MYFNGHFRSPQVSVEFGTIGIQKNLQYWVCVLCGKNFYSEEVTVETSETTYLGKITN